MLLKRTSRMTNDKQDTIFTSKDAKDFSDSGGKNSNEADWIKFDAKIDIKKRGIKFRKYKNGYAIKTFAFGYFSKF